MKYEQRKIHPFSVSDPNNFPICSIYTHVDDLVVPVLNTEASTDQNIPIDVNSISNQNSFEWVELFFAHFEIHKAEDFIRKFSASDYDFNIIGRTPIGQGREILVAARFIQSTKTTGDRPDISDLEGMDNTNRLTVWGYRGNESKHIAVHDLRPSLDRINEIYN